MNNCKLPPIIADAIEFFGVNAPYYFPYVAAANVRSKSGNDVVLAYSIATKISILTNKNFVSSVVTCVDNRKDKVIFSGEAVNALLQTAKYPTDGQTSGLCVLDHDIAFLIRFDPEQDIEISESSLNADCLIFIQGCKVLIANKVV